MSLDSPDMKLARLRLEDLLSNIREQAETPESSDKDEKEELEDEEDDYKISQQWKTQKRSGLSTPGKNEPLRKRSRLSVRKIVFELRQKPFELPNTTDSYSLYKLCRIWLRGKDNTASFSSPVSSPQKGSSEIIVNAGNLKDTKEVYKMPPPLNMWDALRRVPSPVPIDGQSSKVDVTNKEAILGSYMPHWKNVKRHWCKRARQVEKQCFGKNLQMLQNMVALSSQLHDF